MTYSISGIVDSMKIQSLLHQNQNDIGVPSFIPFLH